MMNHSKRLIQNILPELEAGLLEKLRETPGGEGANREVSAWDELGTLGGWVVGAAEKRSNNLSRRLA
jgi:hypothetical protein